MTTFDRLRQAFSGEPEDFAEAWREACALFTALDAERDSGMLAAELREESAMDDECALIEKTREILRSEGVTADYVLFRSSEWDEGSYFTSTEARAYVGTELVATVDFGDEVHDVLRDLFGRVGRTSSCGVHLRTETVEMNDHVNIVQDLMSGMAD